MNSKKKKNVEELQIENWLPVQTNPSYEISDLGRLRHNYKNGKVKIIKPSNNGKGINDYQFYVVDDKKHYAHHLVLHHFVGAKPSGFECDHINSDRTDNRLINLRYLTVAENRSHKGENHGNSKLSDEQVLLIRMLYNNHKNLVSQKKLSNMFDVSPSAISLITNRKSWLHI